MKKLRAAVVGVGYLGRFHAQKYASLNQDIEFVGVCDVFSEQAKKIAEELKTKSFSNVTDLIGKIDIATVATTTTSHYEVAKTLLNAGIHLLVEKPLAATLEQAQELQVIAQTKGLILQVGHIERFNPAFVELKKSIIKPSAFEAFRLAPFKPRALDVDVITDLMIHDIDLMTSVIHEEISNIDAVGTKIMTPTLDMAHAIFTFKSGKKGSIVVNRCYPHAVRTVSVFSDRKHWFADLGQFSVACLDRSHAEMTTLEPVKVESLLVEKYDAMLAETKAFIQAVRGEADCLVPARDGVKSIEIMERVLARINYG